MSEELTVVAVDAMGGDNAPGELVKGAVNAVKDEDNIKVILVGKEDAIKKELGKYEYDENKIEIRNATEIIATDEVPTIAVRRKKDSSLVVAMKMVKQGEADAVAAGVDLEDFDFKMLVEVDHLGGVVNTAVGHLADMHQAVLMHSDIDKCTEGGYVGDDTGQNHTFSDILEAGNVLVELEHLELGSRIESRFLQLLHDIT